MNARNEFTVTLFGHVEVTLTQGQIALVDLADWERLSKFRWYAIRERNTWNAATTQRRRDGSRRIVRMHQLVCKARRGQVVDHKFGNGLDNRRNMLRAVSVRRNSLNRNHPMTSCYQGVYWNSERRSWRAQIRIKGRKKSLGDFQDETLAAQAYQKALAKVERRA